MCNETGITRLYRVTLTQLPGAAPRVWSKYWLDRTFRVLCAFALVIVTTFHVCDVAAARVVDVVPAFSDAGDDGTSGDVIVVEKCHICAVASLPAIITGDDYVKVMRSIPPGSTLHVMPFGQPAIGPPPRA